MSLPASGPISFSNLNVELGLSPTATLSFDDLRVRHTTADSNKFSSGSTISTGDLFSKSWVFYTSLAGVAGTLDYRNSLITNGWDQFRPAYATLTSTTYSTSTGSPAMSVTGTFPYGTTLAINSGVYVAGKGGAGGTGANGGAGGAGGAGGTGIAVSLSGGNAISIVNNGAIGGGGGGGGGGGFSYFSDKHGTVYYYGGGGGGAAAYGAGGSSVVAGGASGGILYGGAGGSGAGGIGGTAGSLGNAGGSGTTINGAYPAGAGGPAGAAMTGTSGVVNFITPGTIYGSVT